jgi:hypothetical protein
MAPTANVRSVKGGQNMGYTTDFFGSFGLTPTLKPEHRDYLVQFNRVRHFRRKVDVLETRPDTERIAVGLPLENDGEFYVGEEGSWQDEAVIDYNKPPAGVPELWCQWVPTEDGTEIEWDGAEKFYEYVDWLQYLVDHFLEPWGYQIDGSVEWAGEDHDDRGQINVKDNKIEVAYLVAKFLPRPSWESVES